jgi:hypothetical protein
MDRLAGRFGNRAAVIEKAICDHIAVSEKRRRDTEDPEILNRR